MRLPHLYALLALAVLALLMRTVPGARAQDASMQPAALEAAAPALNKEELDQLVAPIALYSDKLLAQVLMASTYPLEIVEADRWVREHSSLKGEALLTALDKERWDASVKSLAQVPQVLKMMSEKLDWTQRLGDAFLGQQEQVMSAVQRLRQMADKAGNLKSGEQQTIVREPASAPVSSGGQTVVQSAPAETIIIQDTSPEVIYVPDYNPTVAYGAWPYPAYPPYYWGAGYYGAYAPFGGALAWGAGMAITAGIWDNAFDWGGGDININNNFNSNRWNSNRGNWNHRPEHRRGVNYRDQGARDRFAKGDRNSAARRDFRGRDGARGGGRDTPRLSNRDMTAGNRGDRSGARDTPRLSNRDMTGGNRGGRDNLGNRGGRDNQMGNRGGNRANQYGNRGGRDNQMGNRGGGNRQYGNRGGGSRYGQGGPSYGSRGAANRGYGGGGRSYGGRSGGFDGIGRGGSTRSFSSRGGGSRGGMRGGGRGGGRRR